MEEWLYMLLLLIYATNHAAPFPTNMTFTSVKTILKVMSVRSSAREVRNGMDCISVSR